MTADRIALNAPDNCATASLHGAIDDLVIRNAGLVHLEAMSDNSAFLAITRDGDEHRLWLRARPATRAERRDILRHDDDRLIDHLNALLPRALGGHSIWRVPWWRRPASVWRSWREAVNQARVVLDMREEQ